MEEERKQRAVSDRARKQSYFLSTQTCERASRNENANLRRKIAESIFPTSINNLQSQRLTIKPCVDRCFFNCPRRSILWCSHADVYNDENKDYVNCIVSIHIHIFSSKNNSYFKVLLSLQQSNQKSICVCTCYVRMLYWGWTCSAVIVIHTPVSL